MAPNFFSVLLILAVPPIYITPLPMTVSVYDTADFVELMKHGCDYVAHSHRVTLVSPCPNGRKVEL